MASIGDVAKLAGVSRSTVSLVCNNKGYVSDETRKKIEKAMKELNYIPFNYKENAQSRNRTSDTRIFSPLLYQLSYLGFFLMPKA